MRKDKGIAGLDILLGVVILIFILGIILFVFATLGGTAETTAWDDKTSAPFTNLTTDRAINNTNCANVTGINSRIYRGCILTITQMNNWSTGDQINPPNYTIMADCSLCLGPGITNGVNNSKWNASGYYTYLADTAQSKDINRTTSSLNSTTSYMNIIIVLVVLVVLSLLVTLILSSLRGTGEVDFEGRESAETA